jgi:hypothetical protein
MRLMILLTPSVVLLTLLVTLILAPAFSWAAPSLDVDQRFVRSDTEPPYSTVAEDEFPTSAFDPFSGTANQGGFKQCFGPMPQSVDATGNATQTSSVAPLAFAGNGSASFTLLGGTCDGTSAAIETVYEITFTTDAAYDFNLDATLDHANLLLENDDGTLFASETTHTGVVSSLQTLPADTYTIRVDVSFFESPGMGNSASDSGSFDFTLALSSGAAPAPGFGMVGLIALAGLLGVTGRRCLGSQLGIVTGAAKLH